MTHEADSSRTLWFVPRRFSKKVDNRAVGARAFDRVSRRPRRDRLDALSLSVAHDSLGVGGEAFPLLAPRHQPTNSTEPEGLKSILHLPVGCVLHARSVALVGPNGNAGAGRRRNRCDKVGNKRHPHTLASPAKSGSWTQYRAVVLRTQECRNSHLFLRSYLLGLLRTPTSGVSGDSAFRAAPQSDEREAESEERAEVLGLAAGLVAAVVRFGQEPLLARGRCGGSACAGRGGWPARRP